ncbi:MAG: peptide ABC transporter substrate-binding protein [Oscillospiraceae bacterium]|nr:peptide ABC transporter substrate-binding protein [Oscillospiraceae bacterium]
MKKLLALLLALCMLFTLAACASKDSGETTAAPAGNETQEPGGKATEAPTPVESDLVINACIASEPETIDPSLISSVDGSTYTQHQFENLMRYALIDENPADDPNMKATEVALGQAKEYKVSDDQKVYTFILRDDIFWSDGEPVKAQDWVYSWQRLVDPATAADYGYFLDGIVLNAAAIQAGEMDKSELGIKALDEKTLEITLEAPCTYFLEMCAFASLVPLRQDVVEGSDNWTDPANIVVNGPYKITEWVHDSKIVMEKNEKYYNLAELGPKQIVWWLSDSETAILSSYKSSEYQFIENFPTDMIQSLRDSGDCFINPYVGTYYLYINCDKIPDWRVRAAMVLAVDRENIVENVTQGGQSPATGFVASGILDSTGADFAFGVSELGAIRNTLQKMYPDYDLSTYDGCCELAIDLYNEAVDEGAWDPNTTVVYNFNTSESHKAIAEACGYDWKSVLGLNITLENQDWNTYTNGLGEHTFGVARLGWIADYNDPITYLELLVTGNSYNYGLYSDPKFDEKIAGAKAMEAGADRDTTLYEAEETLFGEGGFPVCPVYYYTNMYCMKGLKNVGYTTMGYFFFMYATENK